MGRILIVAGAVLLLVTAAIHAFGVSMVREWAAGLGPRQSAALQFVWLSDSLDWAVAAVIWIVAAIKRQLAWRAAAGAAAIIPLAGAVAVISIDPGFFGGYLLLGSVILALAGLAASGRRADNRPTERL